MSFCQAMLFNFQNLLAAYFAENEENLLEQVFDRLTEKLHKAVFDLSVCTECALADTCPTGKRKNHRVWHFTRKQYLALKRQQVLHTLPEARKRLRNNVEAKVDDVVCRMHSGKLKVRGAFKA